MVKPAEILRGLVEIPSVSSLSNVPVVNYALKFLNGFTVERYPYTDPAGTAKLNIVAATQRGPSELALVCHTDTVPFDPDWAEAVNPQVRGGKLYGRGTTDMKGFVATCLAMVPEMQHANLATPIHLAISYDEEIGCVGVAHFGEFRLNFAANGRGRGIRPRRNLRQLVLADRFFQLFSEFAKKFLLVI